MIAFAFASIGTALSCRGPTQIVIVASTDVPCDRFGQSAITVGTLDTLASRPPVTTSAACDPVTGSLGSLVIIPSGANTGEVAVQLVVAIGKSVEACVASHFGPGCIVARRAIRFIPHTPLSIGVPLRASCDGVTCDPQDTCVDGTCRSAVVADPESCASSVCDEAALVGASTPADGGADGDATVAVDAMVGLDAMSGTDAMSSSDGTIGLDATSDAPVDATLDAKTDGATGTGLPGTPTGGRPIKSPAQLFDPTTTVGGVGCPFLSGIDGAWRWTVSVLDGKISFAVPCKQQDQGNWPQILLLQYDPVLGLSVVDAEPGALGVQGVVQSAGTMSDAVTIVGSVKTTFLAQNSAGNVLMLAQGYGAGAFRTIPGVATSVSTLRSSVLSAAHVNTTNPPGPDVFAADNAALIWDPDGAQFVRINEMHSTSPGFPYLSISTSTDGLVWTHLTGTMPGLATPHLYSMIGQDGKRYHSLIAYDAAQGTWVHVPGAVAGSPLAWAVAKTTVLHLESLQGSPGAWDYNRFDQLHAGQPTIAGFAAYQGKVYGFYNAGALGSAGGTQYGTSDGIGAFELPVYP